MKRFSVIFILLVFAAFSLLAQKKTPEEKSIVNKQYDDQGNLIGYDSTYVWSFNSDSAFTFDFPLNGTFNNQFFQGFGDAFMDSIMNQHFNQQFFNFNPFEEDEFSIKEFEQMQKEFQKQFEQFHELKPKFESDEQRREWEELIKKQKKEKEALMKKWKEL